MVGPKSVLLGMAVIACLALSASAADAERIAVAAFEDKSGSRIDNLGPGFADKLADALAAQGVRVVGRGDVETVMQEESLDPTSPAQLARTALELGADLLVIGAVDEVSVDSAALDLGLLQVGGAWARVSATARLIDASLGAATFEASVTGTAESPTSLSLDLGSLLSGASASNACGGGVRSDQTAYGQGQLVTIGYSNAGTPAWLGVEIIASDGTFLRWLGWRFVDRDECETWIWNQRDTMGLAADAGLYTAQARLGDEIVGAVTFQIRPSLTFALPSLDVVTVGTTAFDRGVVGLAVDAAVAQLAGRLLAFLEASPAAAGSAAAPPLLLGQIAAVSPEGEVTINLGAASGVGIGDQFEILAVDQLEFDPETEAVLSYNVVRSKGVVRVVDVRDRVSTGACAGTCDLAVGDFVRRVP